jgi:hypothetical protein
MPQEPIPFVPDQQSGWSARAGGSPLAVNVVIDGRGAVRRRPGITSYQHFPPDPESPLPLSLNPTPIIGLYVTLDGNLYVVDSAVPVRHIFVVKPTPLSVTNLSTTFNSSLVGGRRPIFAETEAALFIAGGGEAEKILLSTPGASRLSPTAPQGSHIIANSSRLLMNDVVVGAGDFGWNTVFYSATGSGSAAIPGGHVLWPPQAGAGFFGAEARPDKVIAIHENTNEVFVFGETTLQVFNPDPTFVYAPLPTLNHGLVGPYGAIEVDQKIAFLDHRRRFVITNGRSVEYIGEPIQATLDDMAVVTDVFGYRVRTNVIDCLCWCFPTDGRTFVYQINSQRQGSNWALWMGWDTATNNFKRLVVNAHHHVHTTGWNIVGMLDGRVGLLSMDSSTDLGQPINAHIETGFVDRGTDLLKHCVAVHLALKRGEVVGATAPIAWLKWRDAPGPWTGAAEVSLGASGDREITVVFRSLGVYRRREWLFEFAGTADLELTRATEVFEVLSN